MKVLEKVNLSRRRGIILASAIGLLFILFGLTFALNSFIDLNSSVTISTGTTDLAVYLVQDFYGGQFMVTGPVTNLQFNDLPQNATASFQLVIHNENTEMTIYNITWWSNSPSNITDKLEATYFAEPYGSGPPYTCFEMTNSIYPHVEVVTLQPDQAFVADYYITISPDCSPGTYNWILSLVPG